MNETFMQSLWILVHGMSGVFIVIMVFYITIQVLNLVFPPHDDEAQ